MLPLEPEKWGELAAVLTSPRAQVITKKTSAVWTGALQFMKLDFHLTFMVTYSLKKITENATTYFAVSEFILLTFVKEGKGGWTFKCITS